MKKIFRNALLAAMIGLTLTACQSKEEKAISKLEAITEKIETKGDTMTDEEWDKTLNDYKELSTKMSKEDYQFTDEQESKVNKMHGQVIGAASKHAAKQIGKGIGDAIKQGGNILKGIAEGLKGDDEE